MSFLNVKIYHGPCTTFNFECNKHKPQYLNGLKDRLMKLGYRVQLIPVEYLNYCMVEICGHEVFRCNIKNLKFNTSFRQDSVCMRAVEAVQTSSVMFRRARACLWCWTLIDRELFTRNRFGPKDYWVRPIEHQECSTIQECIKCCNIITEPVNSSDDNNSK